LAALLKQIGAKTADARDKIRKINFPSSSRRFFKCTGVTASTILPSIPGSGEGIHRDQFAVDAKMTGVPIFKCTSDAPPSMAVFKMR